MFFGGERRAPAGCMHAPHRSDPLPAFGRWEDTEAALKHQHQQQHQHLSGFFSRPPPSAVQHPPPPSFASPSSSSRFSPYASTSSSCTSSAACMSTPSSVNFSVFGPPQLYQQYPEDPAEFKPLTEDELQRIKRERRQKEAQRKQKAAESRRHLANVRVVQKNLVFVVGLSQRLADHEALKKHEYFGKFGKIHKVVINQSTSYAGSQGPSASAYVTYHKPEDALRAIQAVNNIHVDGRTLKASLGTTKYCSHFLRGTVCPKPDCMYLHELGEEAASFTKEEMQQGKHQEYEQKLVENFLNSQNLGTQPTIPTSKNSTATRKKSSSPVTSESPIPATPTPPLSTEQSSPTASLTKEPWPSLAPEASSPLHKPKASRDQDSSPTSSAEDLLRDGKRSPLSSSKSSSRPCSRSPSPSQQPPSALVNGQNALLTAAMARVQRKSLFNSADSMSLFSDSGFPANHRLHQLQQQKHNQPPSEHVPTTQIPDSIPVSSSTDWQAAFGFKPQTTANHIHSNSTSNTTPAIDSQDDDLGFDPWNESSKALADLIEKEAPTHHPRPAPGLQTPHGHSPMFGNKGLLMQSYAQQQQQQQQMPDQSRVKTMPPGFNHLGAYPSQPPPMNEGSRLMGLMHLSAAASAAMHPQPPHMTHRSSPFGSGSGATAGMTDTGNAAANGSFNNQQQQDWQDGLRALLPNINISFGSTAQQQAGGHRAPMGQQQSHHQKDGVKSPDLPWDPAIVSTGHIDSGNLLSAAQEDTPHWMASLHHLTEDQPPSSSSSRLPLFQQLRNTAAAASGASTNGWAMNNSVASPPPGFQQSSTSNRTDAHQLAEGLQ